MSASQSEKQSVDEDEAGEGGRRQIRKGVLLCRLHSAGEEEVLRCLMGDFCSLFAWKVILQAGQMDNHLERMLMVRERETQFK